IAGWTEVEERRAIIRHELAHVERRDTLVNLFLNALSVLFFFHPMVRYTCRQLRLEREMACDDRVISSGSDAVTYAEGLLKVAEHSISSSWSPSSVHGLALISAKHILERRIEMILNKDRARVIALRWKYLILPVTLIALVAWLLLPSRLTKPGLAQQVASDALGELAAKYMGDSKNFDDLVEMALTNPDPEMRRKAVLRLHILEGDGSTAALVKLYNKSNDPMIRGMVIHSLGLRGANEQLAVIAQVEQSPEFRQMANAEIKRLKENTLD